MSTEPAPPTARSRPSCRLHPRPGRRNLTKRPIVDAAAGTEGCDGFKRRVNPASKSSSSGSGTCFSELQLMEKVAAESVVLRGLGPEDATSISKRHCHPFNTKSAHSIGGSCWPARCSPRYPTSGSWSPSILLQQSGCAGEGEVCPGAKVNKC
uniref:(northern house mosquito) hypothetical protein n=1 Tax=Culex pipiens TaxID=7175 RepID=A0A8D8CJY5_CULPI